MRVYQGVVISYPLKSPATSLKYVGQVKNVSDCMLSVTFVKQSGYIKLKVLK